jgi:hypothetical protein
VTNLSHLGLKARFRLAYAALAAILALTYVAFFVVPWPHVSVSDNRPAIDPADYGHVQAYDGYMLFTLAPNTDQRRKYELGFGRVMFTSAGLAVSSDGKRFYPLQGEPMGNCGYHWQGYGLNVIVAIGKCVPVWATVSGDPKTHAAEWLRVENLAPVGRRVLLKYDPMGG